MEEVSIDRIESKAKRLDQEGAEWHFHMLTPDCVFNPRDDLNAFVVEDSSEDKVFVSYTSERQFDLGEELVQLLHDNVLDNDEEKEDQEAGLSEKAQRMVGRARELNQENISWHHHNLFPNCFFNEYGNWCLVFEDPETGEVIESIYEEEPEADLEAIEELYYQQEGT